MKAPINHGYMRSNNKRSVFNYIHLNSNPVSKKDIVQQLNLSFTSVSTFIAELLRENLIIRSGCAASTGGRKSELFRPNPDAFYVIGADIQINCLVVLLLNACGNMVQKTVIPLGQQDAAYVGGLLSDTITDLCNSTDIAMNKLVGIGIGVPGIVDHNTGKVAFAPNLSWKNLDLKSLLNIKKPIVIENEANAAVIGETAFGIAQGIANVIYVSVGAGIGTGLVFNRQLFVGKNSLAGEFGHMTVEAEGISCRCGNRGCWEAYASNEAAVRLYLEYAGRSIITYGTLLELFSQKDPIALRVMEETMSYLALGIANLINGLNPEMIVLGGELARVKDQIYPRLLQMIGQRTFDSSFQSATVHFSSLDNHAAALGAGSLAINQHLATF